MRIVLNGGGFTNKGAEAMLLTVQGELTKRLPQPEFVVWRPAPGEPDVAREAGFFPAEPLARLPFRDGNRRGRAVAGIVLGVRWLLRGGRPAELGRLLRGAGRASVVEERYIESVLDDFCALVDVSGFAYGDTWGLDAFERVAPLADYCRARGRPAVFLPQAWGSFVACGTAEALRGLLTPAGTVAGSGRFYSRDTVSSRHLESALGLAEGSVPTYPDIVFLFAGGDRSQGERILGEMGCLRSRGARPLVTVAPNRRVYERSQGEEADNDYLRALSRLARHCIDGHDLDVVLQANEIDRQGRRLDDRHLCRVLSAAVDRPGRCFHTDAVLTAAESRALLGRADFVVGSRFHSLVFALSQGVPCVGVSWSHKYGELFRDLGMQEYMLELDGLEPEMLLERFDQAWTSRASLSRDIHEKVGEYRAKLEILFDEVAGVIRQAG